MKAEVRADPDFIADSLVNMRPKAEIREWLAGDEMDCPLCHRHMSEGADCSSKHYEAYGELVRTRLEA